MYDASLGNGHSDMISAKVGCGTGAVGEKAANMMLPWIRGGTLGLTIRRRMSTASDQNMLDDMSALKTGARSRVRVRQIKAEKAS